MIGIVKEPKDDEVKEILHSLKQSFEKFKIDTEVRNIMTRDDQVRADERIEIAENLLEMGMFADDIAKGTGLSIEIIEMIRDETG